MQVTAVATGVKYSVDRGARGRAAVSERLPVLSFLVAVVLCGILFGSIVAGELGRGDSLALAGAVERLLQAISLHQLAPGVTLWRQRVIADGKLLVLLWLCGASLLGAPIIVIALFLRSFSVGFAVGFTVIEFGWHGVAVAAVAIFSHQLFSLTALLMAAAVAIRFSRRMLRQSVLPRDLPRALVRYTCWFTVCAVLLMFGAAMEALLTPPLLATLTGGA